MTISNNRKSTRILMRCPNGARTLRPAATLLGSRTPVTNIIFHPHFLGIRWRRRQLLCYAGGVGGVCPVANS